MTSSQMSQTKKRKHASDAASADGNPKKSKDSKGKSKQATSGVKSKRSASGLTSEPSVEHDSIEASGSSIRRLEPGEPPEDDHIVLRSSQNTSTGPILVSAPNFAVPPNTPFTLYTAPAPNGYNLDGAQDASDERYVLSGENDIMHYISTNGDYTQFTEMERGKSRMREYEGEYLIGIYDPETSAVTLRLAPLLSIQRRVKALNSLEPMAIGTGDWQARQLARRDLGNLFGNRKMKAKASNEDRMRVDGSTEGMQKILKQVTAGISTATSAFASEMPKEAMSGGVSAETIRYIPAPNLQATHPSQAFSIDAIIPSTVFRALDVKWLAEAESEEAAAKQLPSPGPARSAYLLSHVWNAVKANRSCNASDNDASIGSTSILKHGLGKERLRLALYASLLFALWRNLRNLNDREKLSGKLKLKGGSGSGIVLEDLLTRFTEEERGTHKRTLTRPMETKLLAYMAAIFLHLDSFSVDITRVAAGLELPHPRVQEIFKSLGCTPAQIAVSGSGDGATKKERRMVLKVPLTFPKPKRGMVKR
ncbi:hypothetical protein K437DRAFT_254923 [Tilletiaria anomala UBC 951]|uniref:RNA polymerase I associated factor, A49-like protein n=1 Tax=Tilletiaria anomala (strain ATCC 24038 / CBS 436.72 / UBC 951) TaxID=1037660 RepID=A0A066WL62_TILAU|nr:uncharacterized protein K437DRAFT_254923 [Tilletiaria anomala UBC 951]KDN51335.1 hypothetical protein K437DRAFT_254923 [Tilletiaria anomala UBC 951]